MDNPLNNAATSTPVGPRFEVLTGDVSLVAKELEAESFDGCFCDAPYGLSQQTPGDIERCLTAWLAGDIYEHGKAGFCGHAWDSWVPGPEAWREVYRVLKPGARCAVFAGTRTQDLMRIAMELSGLTYVDTVFWAHASGFPKSHAIGKSLDRQAGAVREVATEGARLWDGYGTQMKPAQEPILVMRKPGNAVANPVLSQELFYFAKPPKKERNAGLPADAPNKHPTLKGLRLTSTLASKLFARGGRCLVPFSGSGSEVIGALMGGFDSATGIELSEEYAAIARARLSHWVFDGEAAAA